MRPDLSPYLRFDVHNVVEAIAATRWVDRHSGVKYEKCDYRPCGKLFQVTSKHGRKFCPIPSKTESFCANAHKKSEARRKQDDFVALFLEGRRNGLSEKRIRSSRAAKAIGLAPKALEAAVKRAKEQAKQQTRGLLRV